MMPKIYDSLKDRLIKNREIDLETGCWLWKLSTATSEHGQIRINGRLEMVHRIAYQEFIGPIYNLVLHKQNCPNPNCFNPEHLYDGSHQENAYDRMTVNPELRLFGASITRKNQTHCKHGHEYTEENTGRDKRGGRYCKTCSRISSKLKRGVI